MPKSHGKHQKVSSGARIQLLKVNRRQTARPEKTDERPKPHVRFKQTPYRAYTFQSSRIRLADDGIVNGPSGRQFQKFGTFSPGAAVQCSAVPWPAPCM